jgi:hypothetical protein
MEPETVVLELTRGGTKPMPRRPAATDISLKRAPWLDASFANKEPFPSQAVLEK